MIAFLAASCTFGRSAAPTPAPTPVPTPGPPKGAEPAVAANPDVPGNAPTPLPGRTNGQLPATDLVEVTPTCLTARAAAPSMARMLDDAHAHGVALSTTICYRPEAQQTNDRASACSGGNCACAAPTGHSMHGWGKAADLRGARGPIVSTSDPTHLWLKANAARYGWNHPGWAEPGGSPCPEPWHWEWVGDGGVMHLSPVRTDVAAIVADGGGYALCTALGEVIARGPSPVVASSPARDVGPLIGAAALVGNRIVTAGDPAVVGIAATPSGRGYWTVTSSGKVTAAGDARDFGSAAAPVVGIAATRDGKGYWVAGASGAVYAFGDAAPQSSPAGVPVAAIAPSAHGGYWLVTRDGRVIAQGGAPFLGSLVEPPRLAVVAVAGTSSGYGYWVATADGGVFAFGDAGFYGTA
jgi:hypothetical protein